MKLNEGNLCPIYPLFPCSEIFDPKCGGWMMYNFSFHVFFAFYAISNIFRNKFCWREISGDRVAL